ncbi:MAG: hypothetical protein RLZZ618_3285 [Pseudomonadota bacterium]|jgi:hypothetical protein
MDQQRIDFFQATYARMPDEQLAHLLITRGQSLTEEAHHALMSVVRTRDHSAFRQEFKDTALHVHAQTLYTRQEAEQNAANSRAMVKWFRTVCAAVAAAGLLVCLSGDGLAGLLVMALAAVVFVIDEMRRHFWNSLVAMFRLDD